MPANGRWIQGDAEQAEKLYDQAVAQADLEAEALGAAPAEGAPRVYDYPWAQALLRWTTVDARFWRGLLRAERGNSGLAVRIDPTRTWIVAVPRYLVVPK